MPRRSPSELSEYLGVNAMALRANPTKAETAVRAQLAELGFWFQYPKMWETKNGGYGGAIFDFYHPGAALIVEIDGGSHKRKAGRDRRRDTRFGVEGIETVRFTNRETLKNPEAVVGEVEVWVQKRLARIKQEMER